MNLSGPSAYPLRMLAYIDPGAGSLILQVLAGGIAGLMVMGKLYWGASEAGAST